MSTTTTTSSGGIGVLGLLGVVFVTLKLLGITEVATWSWWWVTAPFWGGLALVLGLMLIAGAGAGVALGIAALIDWRTARKRAQARMRRDT